VLVEELSNPVCFWVCGHKEGYRSVGRIGTREEAMYEKMVRAQGLELTDSSSSKLGKLNGDVEGVEGIGCL